MPAAPNTRRLRIRKPWKVSGSLPEPKVSSPRWNRHTPSPTSPAWCANSPRTRWSWWASLAAATRTSRSLPARWAKHESPGRGFRGDSVAPVVLLTYFNPVVQYGVERFCGDARAAGVDGIVVPDLPADEADALISPARAPGLDTIFLVAPTTSDSRIRLAAERSRGFLYCVSLTGVTGARTQVPPDVEALVGRVKALSL